jgi:hypothetical protein
MTPGGVKNHGKPIQGVDSIPKCTGGLLFLHSGPQNSIYSKIFITSSVKIVKLSNGMGEMAHFGPVIQSSGQRRPLAPIWWVSVLWEAGG